MRLNREFNRKYQGPGVSWLEKGLRVYMEMYNSNLHYGKTIFVLQSSGAGKSRVVAELARLVGKVGLSEVFIVAHPTSRIQRSIGV